MGVATGCGFKEIYIYIYALDRRLRIKARDIVSVRVRIQPAGHGHVFCLMSDEVHSEVSLTVQRSFGVVLPRP